MRGYTASSRKKTTMTPEEWEQIERIFNQALSLPPTQRQEFLNQACGSNAELRRQIELMIESDEDTGFLNTPVAAKADSLFKDDIKQNLTGSILSHYKILERIGAGGMGEIYLAEDTQLLRKVALKILPAKYTQDQDWLQRFRREALAIAKLNHQNIITVFEVAEVDGIHFIATEFVDGITLRELLSRGKLELKQSLEIAIQIATAISAAHAAGIVHRDIKPENIMVRPDGLVKTLDFGLAKLTETPTANISTHTSQFSNDSPDLTQKGAMMGTPRYMSPEQVRSQSVDERADIFCLGGVIYEMLAGRPPFTGETTSDLLAAVLEKDPKPLSTLVPKLPQVLEQSVTKALAKDVEKRHQQVGALLSDLKAGRQALEKSRTPRSRFLKWGLVVAGCLMVIAFLVKDRFRFQPPVKKSDPMISRVVDKGIRSGAGIERVSFSPDGNLIAFSFHSDGGTSIWVRSLDGKSEWRLTDGKWRDRAPIWSQDGKNLLFISDREDKQGIWSLPFEKRAGNSANAEKPEPATEPQFVKALASIEAMLLSCAQDDKTVYYEDRSNLYEFDLTSGTQRQLTEFDPKKSGRGNIAISPDWSQIAYVGLDSTVGKTHIFIKPLSGGTATQITHGDSADRYPTWFPDSKSLAYSSNRTGQYQIYVKTIGQGEPSRVISSESQHEFVSVSPKGDRIIYISTKETGRIFSCDVQTRQEVGITSDSTLNRWPESSFDGKKFLFGSVDANIVSLNEAISIQAGVGNEQARLWKIPGFDAKWSPKTEQLAFLRDNPNPTGLELRIFDPKDGSDQLLASGLDHGGFTRLPYHRRGTNYNWSPGGQQIAYSPSQDTHSNIYMISTDTAARDAKVVSANKDATLRATSPFFSPQGDRIAYLLEPKFTSANKSQWSVWVTGIPMPVFSSDTGLRLIGWADSGKEIYLAQRNPQTRFLTTEEVRFLKVAVDSGKQTQILRFPSVYLHSVRLSNDGKSFVFVSRKDGKDNVYEVTGIGNTRKITANNDSELYISGLSWSADRKKLFFSKQVGRSEIWQIQNFR